MMTHYSEADFNLWSQMLFDQATYKNGHLKDAAGFVKRLNSLFDKLDVREKTFSTYLQWASAFLCL